jgi:hypothetical protein
MEQLYPIIGMQCKFYSFMNNTYNIYLGDFNDSEMNGAEFTSIAKFIDLASID